MNKRNAMLICIGLLCIFCSSAALTQELRIPADYELNTAEDYKELEPQVLDVINWLMETPVEGSAEDRKAASAFLMIWLSGTPTVTIALSDQIVTFMDSGECLMIFLAGWTKYCLRGGDCANEIEGNIAGVDSVIDFYQKNKQSLGKLKSIEKYIKMKSKNKYREYIASKVN